MLVPAPRVQRFDIYSKIHKALRACMCNTLTLVGRLDGDDAAEMSRVLGQVRALASMCGNHLAKEDAFIHPAMEERQPGSSSRIEGEHVRHEQACLELVSAADGVASALPRARRQRIAHLYRHLALFIAENLLHMDFEETMHNTVLWDTHGDAELAALEGAIVASLSPEMKSASLRWMVAALSPQERALLFEGMRETMPAQAFDALLAQVRQQLSPADWGKLGVALGLDELLCA
ncbi:MAG: hemerythrin domain-containing protein [Pseudomonadota bacterium]